ncbi:hypothetical protein CEE37_14995 [candidate division LCP-89 bacterium B3_LCP]|uniref:DinB-like domain-containing protein n=1 Tax=candidate division LCP-89 bacterium B3_LCP TaxID=2012998 RepID=A0A532UNR0_UNCL8|nr:MAG: hypothetical protein CEE37_14995 [candidate division LCP-89 bacterium B3_LCP]
MDANVLIKLYRINLMVIEKNLQGVSHEDSLYQPEPGGNSINWVLGHITATRNSVMKVMDKVPVWGGDEAAVYARGTDPTAGERKVIELDKILRDLRKSQDTLLQWLQQVSSEELEASNGDETKYEQLAFLQFHEAYHAGQIGILRRLTGKSGAIT